MDRRQEKPSSSREASQSSRQLDLLRNTSQQYWQPVATIGPRPEVVSAMKELRQVKVNRDDIIQRYASYKYIKDNAEIQELYKNFKTEEPGTLAWTRNTGTLLMKQDEYLETLNRERARHRKRPVDRKLYRNVLRKMVSPEGEIYRIRAYEIEVQGEVDRLLSEP